MIKQYDIQNLKSTIDIVDLAKRLGLNPNSHSFIKSIYKEEKTASLKLFQETGTYKCFSTGQGGDIFNLYAIVQGYDVKSDFRKVIEELSMMYGLAEYSVEIKINKPKLTKSEFKSINKDGIKYTHIYQLFVDQCRLDGNGQEYLKGRGFDLDFLKMKNIKYVSKTNYSNLSKVLLYNFSIIELQEAGLFNTDGKFKGFIDSILIPYYNSNNQIINIQFRLIGENSKNFKYLYLKEIKKTAYNLHLKKNTNSTDTIYFSEGVFDCLMIEQLGLSAIAIPSAGDEKTLSDEELKEVIKNYSKIILAFDNDEAGAKLRQEFGNRLFRLGARNILIKLFPSNIKDVNEYMLYLDNQDNTNKSN